MHPEWSFLIVVYLFLGGLSAGTLTLSAMATLAGRSRRFESIARMGAIAAPWPVLAGTALLVFDLGRPLFFWKLLIAFEPRSPMWFGTWLLTVFSCVSLPYAALFTGTGLRLWTPARPDRWRRGLAMAALPLALGVGVYTGVLLGILAARPLWNTAILPQLFLVSALSTGSALLVLLQQHRDTDRHLLVAIDAGLIAVELLLLATLLWRGAPEGLAGLLHGGYAAPFWLLVVVGGLLAPLAIELAELTGRPNAAWVDRLAAIAPVLVLGGGFALRWVIVLAGQASSLA